MLIAPPVVQRCLATRKPHHIRTMFMAFAAIYLFYRILMVIANLGPFASGATHLLNPKKDLLSTFIKHVCQSPLGQTCLLLVIFAIAMSTADSYLNALSILWTQNVLKPLQKNKSKIRTSHPLQSVRMVALGLGIISTIISLFVYETPLFQLLGYAHMALSCLTIPFLLGLMGLKRSPYALMVSVGSFFFSVFALGLFHKRKIAGITSIVDYMLDKVNLGVGLVNNDFHIVKALWFLALPISTVVFLVAHYLEHGAFVFVEPETTLEKRYCILS